MSAKRLKDKQDYIESIKSLLSKMEQQQEVLYAFALDGEGNCISHGKVKKDTEKLYRSIGIGVGALHVIEGKLSKGKTHRIVMELEDARLFLLPLAPESFISFLTNKQHNLGMSLAKLSGWSQEIEHILQLQSSTGTEAGTSKSQVQKKHKSKKTL
mgnify:CR=1 FL=1